MNIPFIFQRTKSKECETGVRINLIASTHGYGNSYEKGLNNDGDASGVWVSGAVNAAKDFKGLSIAGIFNSYVNAKGAFVSGMVNTSAGTQSGVSISGILNYVQESLNGVSISGLGNITEGELNGSSYGTIGNWANYNGRIAVQIGLFNGISEYNPQGFVLQIGLFNRAGNKTMPLINMRGLLSRLKD
jgi:hypothetical protein